MKKVLIAILTVCCLTTCSMPETKIYSIYVSTPSVSPVPQEATKVQTGKFSDTSLVVLVSSPRYLSQPYIAYRNSPYQLDVSKYSKWEASPNDMLSRSLKEALSSEGIFKEVRSSTVVPEGFYSLEIDLKKFERYDEGSTSFGDLALEAKLLSPEDEELNRTTIAKRVRLEDKSFLNLAKGLSSAVNDSVREIRDVLVNNIRK